MGSFGQPEEADRLARLVADVLDAAADARRTLAQAARRAGGPQAEDALSEGAPAEDAPSAAAALARFIEETALAALVLRAVREGDLGAAAARREMDRLGACPAGTERWPAPLHAAAARLSGLRRALAAHAVQHPGDISHGAAQRKAPRQRPSGRPRLRLVGSEGL